MIFQVGDQVVHWTYGLGEIIKLDEKMLYGRTSQYYVVKIRDLMIWVLVSDDSDFSLRYPTPPGDFEALFKILSGPAQPLPDDSLTRKKQLSDQLKDGKLTSVCQTLRDLAFYRKTKKMNDNDKTVMERARNFLLNEWAHSLSVSDVQASKHLNHLLGEEITKTKGQVYRKGFPSAWR